MFAEEGLRTLVMAKKDLTLDEYETCVAKYDDASDDTQTAEERHNAAFEPVEKDLELLGCTAIEDKLQVGKLRNYHLINWPILQFSVIARWTFQCSGII